MTTIPIIQSYEDADKAILGLENEINEIGSAEIVKLSHSITYCDEDKRGLGKWTLTAIIITK